MTAEQAFDHHHKAVYQFVYRLVGRADFAEDITQDCFLAFLRDPQRWDAARGEIKTFLFSIARNLAFKRCRDDHADLQAPEVSAIDVADGRGDQEICVVVAQMVGRLPHLQREALILFEYEGFRLAEIAAIVKADVGVVKSRLHRARERLKQLLAPYKGVGTHGTVSKRRTD